MSSKMPEKFISISIVEDNKFVRAGWEAVLGDVPDFIVLSAYPSCEDALASEEIGQSDVVLMDIGLPGMSGIEGVKHLLERYPELIIVICTVHDEDEKVFDAICAGAMGYLLKKITPVELIKAIRDAVAGGSPMTPNIARKVIASMQVPAVQNSATDLSERESEVLYHLAAGKSYSNIAGEMFLSVDGVRYHIRNIYEKLQVHSRAEAIAKGHQNRLIRPPKK